MRHKLLALILPIAAVVGCAKTGDNTDYTRFVNTKIGSGGHGHVFVGANVPTCPAGPYKHSSDMGLVLRIS